MRFLCAVVAAVSMATVPLPVAHASEPVTVTLGDRLDWTGEFGPNAALDVEACPAFDALQGGSPCDTLWVRVATATFPATGARQDRMMVAVDFSHAVNTGDPGFQLAVAVRRGEEVVAKSTNHFVSHAVEIEDPPDGLYRIDVAPALVVPGHGLVPSTGAPTLTYRGAVTVERHPPTQEAGVLLPDLEALPPRNVTFATGVAGPGNLLALSRLRNDAVSCYPHERLDTNVEDGLDTEPPRRCLRFDQRIANLGKGPLELRARLDETGGTPAVQRVFDGSGSFDDRPVGTAAFHVTHGHFHFGLAHARLWTVTAQGKKGQLVKEAQKSGFCMGDVENAWFAQPRNSPAAYFLEDVCALAPHDDSDEMYALAGLSVGWIDSYPWFITDQYVDVSGVVDGQYLLELSVNEGGQLHEATLANNTASTLICMREEVRVGSCT